MRYLNHYKIFESVQDIESICERYGITNYTIRADGRIDVDGGVHLYSKNLSKLPLKFGTVTGDFYCGTNQLTGLEGAPSEVGGYFYCGTNQLTSLEGVPTKIVGDFNCGSNQLTSLFGCPRRVVGYFSCVDNKLTSLEHCPKEIVGDFYCNHNQITSLEHCPQHVDGAFNCYNNPVDLIVSSFTGSRKMNEFIELFNYTDIVQGNKVIYDRLVWFYEEIGIQLPDMSEIAKHYKIIR